MLEEVDYAPLAGYLDIRADLASVRRLLVFVKWVWRERTYRQAVFARAAEQGLL
jgi:hypothetical protein